MTALKPQTFARYPGYVQFALMDDPASRPGWDILDLITGDRIDSSHDEAIGVAQAYQSPGNSYGCSPQVMTGQRHFVVRKTQFLMGRKEVDVFGDLNGEIAAAKKRAQEAEDKLKPVVVALATSEARLLAMDADRDRALKERTTMTTTKDKLEADMGKLKRVLGEKVINDVLSPSAS